MDISCPVGLLYTTLPGAFPSSPLPLGRACLLESFLISSLSVLLPHHRAVSLFYFTSHCGVPCGRERKKTKSCFLPSWCAPSCVISARFAGFLQRKGKWSFRKQATVQHWVAVLSEPVNSVGGAGISYMKPCQVIALPHGIPGLWDHCKGSEDGELVKP